MSATDRIARVIVNLALDQTFDYRVPEDLAAKVQIGSKVTIPFGKSSRDGYVVALLGTSEFGDLKEVQAVVGDRPLIPEKLVALGQWISDYYCCSREQATHALLPSVVRGGRVSPKKQKFVRLADNVDIATALEKLGTRAPRQADVLRLLARNNNVSLANLEKTAKVTESPIRALEEKKYIVIEDQVQARNPNASVAVLPTQTLPLNDEQADALQMVNDSAGKDRRDVILLYGVTGSGKTEVYLQAIQACLDRGEESIVLVPEIALTPQTIERFRGRFGDIISILHSHLSDGERYDEWTRINDGSVKIAIGARSAVFAPFRNLGLIVVDEEHEPSYKQDRLPRYNARDIAVMRGHFENATVVLGTATPALESMYNVEGGKYRLARLNKRADDALMPTMEIVDMAEVAMKEGRPQIFSQRLTNALQNALEEGEQVMLFLNRRGYATHMQCLKCGFTAGCDECTVRFTYHRQVDRLVCHMCGETRTAPQTCPECNDANIKYSGLGTEKLAGAVKGILPHARVLRMDSDTMTRKNAYREALTAFRAGDYDILVGTQMIAKGLHFPNVTLVGIVFADLTLNLPDFRAGERTFQLLVQVAGRAGRGELPGHVIVQTYTPFHPALMSAAKQDYDEFYENEIDARRLLNFPPCTHLLLAQFRGEQEQAVAGTADDFFRFLTAHLPDSVQMTPPIPCAILKKRGSFHYQILFTTERIVSLSRYIKQVLGRFKKPKDVFISIDVDPMSVL
ncbi:MAG: primosomal protein N' [Lentisphaeria bacterium]|jgi:primosomal protein N' (replication factor Y)|nr:primosomal protein N' [Lentisphaeria bacterium]MDP7743076.1 primosomal protein N' [Lentisphaeria bacterium]